jgi:UDPglucose 6-dehydrogenase
MRFLPIGGYLIEVLMLNLRTANQPSLKEVQMKIAIAGYGFVGKAHYEVYKNQTDFCIVDPAYNKNLIQDIEDLKGVLCCVGTPSNKDGSCDMSQVFQVIKDTPKNIPILIKSTISLEGWKDLKATFPHHSISFSPEFLRTDYAIQDLENTNVFILSGDDVTFWKSFLDLKNKNCSFFVCEPEQAIVGKYFRNSFLATKVSFFNQIYDFCDKTNTDYEYVRKIISLDPRIGESHTFIDENDRPWGGYCFPKDTSALLEMSKNAEVELSVLQEAVNYNNKLKWSKSCLRKDK